MLLLFEFVFVDGIVVGCIVVVVVAAFCIIIAVGGVV